MLGFAFNLPSGSLRAILSGAPPVPAPTPSPTPTPTPTPTPATFTKMVVQGDSITYNSGGGYAYDYAAAAPTGKSVTVNAMNSRTAAYWNSENGVVYYYLDDVLMPKRDAGDTDVGRRNGGSSWVTEDVVRTGAQIVTAMFGNNDLAVARNAAEFRVDLNYLWGKYKEKGAKFAVCPPTDSRNDGTSTAQDLDLVEYKQAHRNPAVWSQYCDYINPMSYHPDLVNPIDNSLYVGADRVHLTTAGHAKLYEGFKPFADTLFDASRATSTQMYDAAWPGNEPNLPLSTQLLRRIFVSGISPKGLDLGASVSGAGNPQLRICGGVYGGPWATTVGTGSGNGYRIYNGDVIELRLTTSAGNAADTIVNLTIGSETRQINFRTVAAVTPAAYLHGDVEGKKVAGPTHTYAARNFAATGTAVIATQWRANVSGLTVGGVAASRLVHLDGDYGGTKLDIWTAPVTAGARDIVMTAPVSAGEDTRSIVSWGVVTGVDATPTMIVQSNGAGDFDLPQITVPSAGIAIGVLAEYASDTATPATIKAGNTGTTAIDEGQIVYNGMFGLAVARRTTTGIFSWDWPAGGFGPYPRAALAFKAAGT